MRIQAEPNVNSDGHIAVGSISGSPCTGTANFLLRRKLYHDFAILQFVVNSLNSKNQSCGTAPVVKGRTCYSVSEKRKLFGSNCNPVTDADRFLGFLF